MGKIKILQVIPTLKRGGAERLVGDICLELTKRENISVKLVTLRNDNRFTEVTQFLDHSNINSSVQLSLWKKNKINLDSWEGLLNSFKPNIIHSHLMEAEVLTRERLHSGIKYISHFHDNMPVFEPFVLVDLIKKREQVRLYEKYRLIQRYRQCKNNFICISEDTYRYAQANLGGGFRFHLLHNAIRFEQFYSGLGRHFPRTKGIKLLNIGSMFDKKNQRFLLDVLAVLMKMGRQAHLTLLGDGPNRPLLQSTIKELGIEGLVDMPGEKANVESYIREADIYVHSAIYEPFGLVLLEAMAGGLPVVALNGGGNTDIIVNGNNGFLINDQQPEKFAEIVLYTLSDKDIYEKLSANAVIFARDFDIRSYVDNLLNIYLQS